MENKKLVLAYSGGLDTSVILKWLVNLDYEVVCFIGDIGQSDDFVNAKIKALQLSDLSHLSAHHASPPSL